MPTQLRIHFAETFAAHPNQTLRAFATTILPRDGPIPCWGAIPHQFATHFETDQDRLDLLATLLAAKHVRPLLLFLHLNQDRPTILLAICTTFEKLPIVLQEPLAALEQTQAHWNGTGNLPPMFAILRRNKAWRHAAAERFQARIQRLTAITYWTPDPRPGDEPRSP